ncbi:LysR family transcriptional regulator [Thiomicrorhabdus sp. 6S3-12]|uniref:LysR family transcriptional regulator n=1 Tax=Thiomicrorhabdus sp. 6S3-12 TaxID=2819681 RepID=UPI001AACDE9A|nr:LysR family transcriptional regulator [Thiomicrorhabdus sp. 6S3-12]MBO1925047.1 LysR family transcriptional regulator [Thiomicrorhabdus sp. 6S3-12]
MKIDLDALKLEQLSILLAVVEHGSFAAVAQKRNISASSISRTIQGLEKQLGFPLFERSTRHLQLTEAGAIYCESILPGIEMIRTAQAKALDSQNTVQGTLKVTLPPGFGEVKVVPLLKKFRKLHPQLKLELLITGECLDFNKDRIDVAVRVGGQISSDFTVVPLTTVKLYLCASPEFLEQYPVNSLEDVQNVPALHFLDYDTWFFRNLYEEDAERVELPIQRTIYASNVSAVGKMCIEGMGIALVPNWLINEDLRSGNLVRLLPDYEIGVNEFSYKVSLIYQGRGYLPMKTRVFAEFLERELSELNYFQALD